VKPAELDLSVVIVSYNVAHLLGDCLDSLRRESAGLESEVLVVDSGSSDGTVALLRERYPEVRLFASPENLGFAAGNNVALREVRGRQVLLLNPDTIVQPGALQALRGHLDAHPEAGAVGPTLRLGDGRVQPECARHLPRPGNLFSWLLLLDKLEWKLRFGERTRPAAAHPPRGTLLDRFCLLSWTRDRSCEVESICGACMLVRGEVVRQVGLFDEASPLYLDDIDYCRRIRDAGHQVHYVAEATVTHLWMQSSTPSRRAGDFYALGCHAIWLYLRKHHGRAAAAAFEGMALVAAGLRVPLAFLFAPGRHLEMALGLARWALRFPKAAPRFGFASETRAGRPAPEAAA
jgi:GT2 family glycosyltransferase